MQVRIFARPVLMNFLNCSTYSGAIWSIAGPRPVTPEELVRYSTGVDAYLACPPRRITGLWQVSGRSGTTYSKRVACDTFYARNWSMLLDAKIIIVTIPALLD